jgi:hypothetical protein
MLRAVALVLTTVLLMAALACAAAGWHALPFAAPPAILLAALLFERYVYKPIRTAGSRLGPNCGTFRRPELQHKRCRIL